MAQYACSLEDRPIPGPDDEAVVQMSPTDTDLVLVATDERGKRLGAAWTFTHNPPLLTNNSGEVIPEMAVASIPEARGQGVGRRLIEEMSKLASKSYSQLSLNVHLRNPAVRLYTRTGFVVAGAGRGIFGVAMTKDLKDSIDKR